MKPTSASPGARALSASLREVREARKYGLRELSRALEIDPQLLSQWERGQRVPPVEEVARILGYLRVSREVTKRLLHLAKHAKDPNWLDSNPSDLPTALTGIIEYERTATKITNWTPAIVPGLLQTPDYARAILGAGRIGEEEVDRRLVKRLHRQAILTKPEPVRLHAIIGEAAIRTRVGDEDTMSDQIDHLVEVVQQPNISLRIVPLDAGYHPGLIGPFIVYEFGALPAIVHLEHHHASGFLHEGDSGGTYLALARLITGKALGEDGSLALLREVSR
ncbi:helix-turn-helix domain-containing protein [Amycolatopsis sp. NPDC051758]|uniref:helix-turn-helix domain-containing protein n=1 Tax=Amycolatopsis sp. NPDC051758 TaxID=3363935 RepID=UPI0037AAB4E1